MSATIGMSLLHTSRLKCTRLQSTRHSFDDPPEQLWELAKVLHLQKCLVILNRYKSEPAKVRHAYSGSSKHRVSEGLRVVHTVTHCVWQCAGCWQPGTVAKASMSCPVVFEFRNICVVVGYWSACLNSAENLIYLFTSMFDSTWLNKSVPLVISLTSWYNQLPFWAILSGWEPPATVSKTLWYTMSTYLLRNNNCIWDVHNTNYDK